MDFKTLSYAVLALLVKIGEAAAEEIDSRDKGSKTASKRFLDVGAYEAGFAATISGMVKVGTGSAKKATVKVPWQRLACRLVNYMGAIAPSVKEKLPQIVAELLADETVSVGETESTINAIYKGIAKAPPISSRGSISLVESEVKIQEFTGERVAVTA